VSGLPAASGTGYSTPERNIPYARYIRFQNQSITFPQCTREIPS
jgi:hypothetical protein